MGDFSIGQSVSRFEDPRLLRGGGRYVDDVALPNMAYGFVLRSPHAHARIRSIDTRAAEAAPGVLAVLTGKYWLASGFGADLPRGSGLKKRDGAPMFVPPYPALVTDRVKRVGDYVAFVVAETRNQAMDAAELIEIDYEPLPSVTSTAARWRRTRRPLARQSRTTSATSTTKATRRRPTPPSPRPTTSSARSSSSTA